MDKIEILDRVPEQKRNFFLPQECWISINDRGLSEIFRSSDISIPLEIALLPSRHLLDQPNKHLTIDGRAAVLVCSECGDIGCGALFVRVDVRQETVVWRDFVYANTWDPEVDARDGYYSFDRRQYERALLQPAG